MARCESYYTDSIFSEIRQVIFGCVVGFSASCVRSATTVASSFFMAGSYVTDPKYRKDNQTLEWSQRLGRRSQQTN